MVGINRCKPDPIRSLAFGSITGTYAAVGTALEGNARLISWKNDTDAILMLSWDGVEDHYVYPGYSFDTYDLTANKLGKEGFFPSALTHFHIKHLGVAPTLGSFYIQVTRGQQH